MYTYEYTTLQELADVARKHGRRSSGDDGGTIDRLS